MKKKLKTSGNGWELYFSKPILKLLGYNPSEIKLLITSDKGTLLVRPIKPEEVDKYKNNMVRKLQKSGSSYALYLPTPLIEVLNINPETDYLDVIISKDNLTIAPYPQESSS